MLGNMFAAGITPLFGLIIKDLGVSTVKVSKLSSYAVLALGLSVREILILDMAHQFLAEIERVCRCSI